MNKFGYSIFFIIATILLIYVLVLCIIKKSELKKSYIAILVTSILLNAFYLLYLMSDNTKIMRVGIVFTYIMMDWLLVFLLSFIVMYSNVKINKKIFILYFALCLISNVLLFISVFKEFAFNFNDVYKESDHYFEIAFKLPYYFHFVFDYALITTALVLLVYKIVKVPQVYKIKYLTLILSIVFIVVINIVLTTIRYEVDFAILLFAVAALVVEHFSINYNFSKLNKKIKYLLIDEMNDGLLIFDALGNFFYANNKTINLFTSEITHINYVDFISKYENMINSKDTMCFYNDNDRIYLETDSIEFKDKKNKIEAYVYIFYDVTEREERYNERKFFANHDELTNCYNRSRFLELSSDVLSSKPNTKYYVIAINFLEFRLINDYFGYETGDNILKITSSILNDLLEKYDFLYGRMGSDKFAILANSNLIIDNNLADVIYRRIIDDERLIPYSININLGLCPIENGDVAKSYEKAIMSLHYIKSDFEQKIVYYDDKIDVDFIRQHQIITSLDKALSDHEFEIYLQPQMNSYDNSLIGAEALVRWSKSSIGTIYPSEFITLFEKKNVIYKLDLYVWEEAIKFLNKHNDDYDKLSISINISPIDFYHLDVCKVLLELLNKYEVNVSRLKVEITESAFILDKKLMLEKTNELKRHGFIVEMDDFGSGYSTFNMLKDIPIDILKLDLQFLRGNVNDTKSYEIINSIVGMAHRLSIPVIAEGVETKEQLDMLANLNCDLIQGYYYSKPLPLEDFEVFMSNLVVSDFFDFWVTTKERKETFSVFKDLQKSYNNTPLSLMILGPDYITGKLDDVIVYYVSKSCAKNLNLDTTNVRLSKIENVFSGITKEDKKKILDILNEKETLKLPITLKDGRKVSSLSYLVKDKYIAIVLYL